jgi:hypothetical protein
MKYLVLLGMLVGCATTSTPTYKVDLLACTGENPLTDCTEELNFYDKESCFLFISNNPLMEGGIGYHACRISKKGEEYPIYIRIGQVKKLEE